MTPPIGPATGPGEGPGWERLANRLRELIPTGEVDGVWVFPALRRDQSEWGTAILTRVEGERRRIYTARYVLQIKGKERGKFDTAVEEVGSGPLEALDQLLLEVRRRTEDDDPPVAIPAESWFPPAEPEAAAPPPEEDDGSPHPG